MADNNLKILITGALNQNTSATEINKGLLTLQEKIDKLKLTIKIDDSILKTLNDFSTQMSKLGEIAKNTGKVIQENINLDGSRTKTTYFNGVIQEMQQLGIEAGKSGKQQLAAIDEIANGWGKATKEVERFNAAQTPTGGTNTYQQGYQTLKVRTNADDEVLSHSITTNNAKEAQDAQKLIDQQDKLSQSLKKMYDQGILNEQFFENFNKVINGTKNVEEIDKVSAALQRVSQYAKNQNLQQSMLVQSHGLLDSGKNVDTSGIENLVSRLNALNLSEANATREISLIQAELKGFQGTATTAAEEMSTLGNVLKNMSVYFGGFMIFTQVFNAIKDGINTVNDLNKSLTEISIVTYQNQQQVTALGDSYNKLAQQMGVTTQDIANEATELYRQGLSTDQVTERMKEITEYAKISSLDTKTASEIMTSAINSMGVSAKKAADVWSYLGDATATGKLVPLM